jgi:hypothetical protein
VTSDRGLERRNRALVAFTLLTGARDSAIAPLKVKHVELIAGCVSQDVREVRTKFSKTFSTFFFPVGEAAREIVEEGALYLHQAFNRAGLPYFKPRSFRNTLVQMGQSLCQPSEYSRRGVRTWDMRRL